MLVVSWMITSFNDSRKMSFIIIHDDALVNRRRLIDSFLHISVDQTIESPIKFTDQVITAISKWLGIRPLNGVPNSLLFSSHTLTHNIHHGDINFEQQIDVDSLEIKSLQGENWEQLVSSLARINDTNMFMGTVAFSNPVKVSKRCFKSLLNSKWFYRNISILDWRRTNGRRTEWCRREEICRRCCFDRCRCKHNVPKEFRSAGNDSTLYAKFFKWFSVSGYIKHGERRNSTWRQWNWEWNLVVFDSVTDSQSTRMWKYLHWKINPFLLALLR